SWEEPVGTNLDVSDFAVVDFTIQIDGLDEYFYSSNVLVFDLYSYYKTSEIVNTSFYIYDFIAIDWILINDSVKTTFDFNSNYSSQQPTYNRFVNGSGVMIIKLYMKNGTTGFSFSIDLLQVDLWTKLHLSYTRSFNLLGIWKYRWHVVGSNYYSNWTYFNVLQPVANIELISESEYYTDWRFNQLENQTNYIYYEGFNATSDTWSFSSESEDNFIYTTITDDSYSTKFFPDSVQGYTNYVHLMGSTTFTTYLYFQSDAHEKYLLNNLTSDTSIHFYVFDKTGSGDMMNWRYTDEHFSEGSMTWNNQPTTYDYAEDSKTTIIGWNEINGYLDYTTYSVRAGSTSDGIYIRSTEYSGTDYDPSMMINISKYYQDEYLYMQTNETEEISLTSQNLNLNLQSGDKITITYNTTSENRIDLNLYEGITETSSYIMEEGGFPAGSTKSTTFLISEEFTLSYIEIDGVFANAENIIIDSIGISRSVSTNYSNYLEPYGQEEVI
ncbi:hypothetical protein LCGC14_2503930, partial [marine sediment metagenome]